MKLMSLAGISLAEKGGAWRTAELIRRDTVHTKVVDSAIQEMGIDAFVAYLVELRDPFAAYWTLALLKERDARWPESSLTISMISLMRNDIVMMIREREVTYIPRYVMGAASSLWPLIRTDMYKKRQVSAARSMRLHHQWQLVDVIAVSMDWHAIRMTIDNLGSYLTYHNIETLKAVQRSRRHERSLASANENRLAA